MSIKVKERHIHWSNRLSRTRRRGKPRECRRRTSLLDILVCKRRWEERLALERLRSRDNIRAINQGVLVMAEERKLDHGVAEFGRHLGRIYGEILPVASGFGGLREDLVGLETERTPDG
jgi:hypothetical protein